MKRRFRKNVRNISAKAGHGQMMKVSDLIVNLVIEGWEDIFYLKETLEAEPFSEEEQRIVTL